MHKFVLACLLACGVLVLGACSDSSSTPNQTVGSASGGTVGLNGDWLSECSSFNSSRDAELVRNFSNTALTTTRQEWATGNDCEGTVLADRVLKGTVTIGDAIELDFDGTTVTGNQLDFSYSSVLRTVYDQDLLDAFNLSEVCGFSDWELGVAKEIETDEDSTCQATLNPGRGAYFIDDEADPNVLYAASGVEVTEDYPTALNTDDPRVRQ